MKKLLIAGAILALISCGSNEDTREEMADNFAKAMNDEMDKTLGEKKSSDISDTGIANAPSSAGTWKSWVESYSDDMDGNEVTLDGVIEKVTTYQFPDGSESIMAQFGVEGMMKCAITAYFSTDYKEALNAAKKEGTLINFTGTVEELDAFDGVKIQNCTING